MRYVIGSLVGALVGIIGGTALWGSHHSVSFFETPLMRLLWGG